MAEYIERDKLIKDGWQLQRYVYGENYAYAESMNIRDVPAADVRPVVRGRWIRHYEQADTGENIITYPFGWVCSECGRWESENEPFCNCGAMMEES